MLRIGAVRFQNRFSISGLKSVRMHGTQSTPTSGSIPSKSSRLKRKVLFTIGAFVSVTGGVVAYAYVDPSFRRKVEKAVPHSRSIFEAILGSSSFSIAKQQIADARDQIISVLPKKKHEEVLPPLTKIPFSEPKERSLVHVDPVDIKMPHDPAANFQNSQDMSKNEELESSLLSAIHSAETQVRIATKAKFETIEAINEHTRLVKLTVDEPQKADWEKVTSALQHAESLAHRDRVAEVEGRNSIHSLRKVIAQGKDNLSTSRNPLLLNATETANKLSHELDELDGLVSKARQESAILNQYKDLIERSRNQFALEMKSILPNVDINAKAKKLTEEELNALIAHAHLKVDHLRRQLSEQQVREEQNIARAIADQREADERIAAERMALELEDLKRQLDVEIEKAVMENRSSWEIEMEEQLRRTTAAHSEHLEQVIRTQRQLFEIEHSQKVEEAIKLERDIHSRQVGAALSRLEGIEYALNNRVALDSENRRAKQFWIACHNLIESIKYGNKAGDDLEKRRFPLEKSLSLLKQCECEDAFIDNLISAFPEVSKKKGVYTEQDLKNRFNRIYKLGRRMAAVDGNGGTLGAYLWSYLRSVLFFDVARKFTDDDLIDPSYIDNLEILSRAKWYVDRNDLISAIRIAQLLRGEPARVVRDWLVDTRSYLETLLLAQLLMAHAAVSSIRSTY